MPWWGPILLGGLAVPGLYFGWQRLGHLAALSLTMQGALLLVFVDAPLEQMQGLVQKIFYFHVAAALTMFGAFGLVCLASVCYLWKQTAWWDAVARSAAESGVLCCTLVLLTGPLWARPIWGTWWAWDSTLTLTLVLWLLYVAYLMVRGESDEPPRARLAAIVGIIGFVDVPLIRWSVEKWRTLHPKPVLIQAGGSTGLTPAMLLTLLVCVGAFGLLASYLIRERLRLAQSRHMLDGLRQEIDERYGG
jgi:heme exporter protein C